MPLEQSCRTTRIQKRSSCKLTRFGIQGVTELQFLLDTPSIIEVVVTIAKMEDCGTLFRRLNEDLEPKGRIRSITVILAENYHTVRFFDAHPYLVAPVMDYYVVNSANIDRLAFHTQAPFMFCQMWTGLYKDYPDVVSVNDYPLAYYGMPATQESIETGQMWRKPAVNGWEYVTKIYVEAIDDDDDD